jgi:hypothetical protein
MSNGLCFSQNKMWGSALSSSEALVTQSCLKIGGVCLLLMHVMIHIGIQFLILHLVYAFYIALLQCTGCGRFYDGDAQ